MRIAKSVFVAIDKVFKLPQNPRIMEKHLVGVESEKDIVYDERYPNMALDLYFVPRENARFPVIFEIHGGGFSAGDKKYRDCHCRFLAKYTGAMVVNVNYGVGKENACPLPMQHLAAAVNWVVKNADKHSMDLSKFVVTGDSAGAFYACFLAALQDSVELQELFECKIDARITATVLNCGVYDMTAYLDKKRPIYKSVCVEFLGVPPREAVKSRYLKGVNLVSHVSEKFPPSFVIYAKRDVFCKGQAEKLLEKLHESNVPVESVYSSTLLDNHTYSLVWRSKVAQQTNKQMIEFLNKHFKD